MSLPTSSILRGRDSSFICEEKTWKLQDQQKSDADIHFGRTWTSLDRLSNIRTSDVPEEIKRDLF